jgi:outer membrane receptor protein involved in Fe transport
MRAPTSVELSCANPNSPCSLPTGFNGDPDLKAVIARTYELGARGRLAGNTLWSFAVYDTKLSNDIQFVTANSTTGYFANVGDTERRGFEGGIGGKYNKLFLGANYGYVDARYKSAWSSLNGDVVSGNKIPGIPNQTLKIRAAYDVTSKLLVGTNLILVSGQYAHGDEVNQQIKVPGYGVMNLDVRYKLNDELSLFALANNVLNKTYSTYGVMGTNIYNGQNEQFRTPAAGRAVWVGLTYTFGGKRLNKIDKD